MGLRWIGGEGQIQGQLGAAITGTALSVGSKALNSGSDAAMSELE